MVLCNNCRRQVDIEVRYKRLGGDSEKIMRELSDNYRQMMLVRAKADNFYLAVKNKSTIPSTPVDISELERIYGQIMLNLSLLGSNDKKNISEEYRYFEGNWLCYSCSYIQVSNLLSFLTEKDVLTLVEKYDREGFIKNLIGPLAKLHREDKLSRSHHNKIVEVLGGILLLSTQQGESTVEEVLR